MAEDVFPADPNSPVGQVRLLIGDTIQDHGGEYIFSDGFIGGYLTINAANVKYAAADALDVLATNEAYVSKKLRSESVQTDGASVANAIRLHAAALRARARQEAEELDAESAVEIVDFQDPVSQWDLFEYGGGEVILWR
jgi:hypothetical protein